MLLPYDRHEKAQPPQPRGCEREIPLSTASSSTSPISPLQLRVIRAFRSTLEDMEERRSIHSLRSGGRVHLPPRPTSDGSNAGAYAIVEEDSANGRGLGPRKASHLRTASPAGSFTRHAVGCSAVAGVGGDSSRVEVQAYRVQRTSALPASNAFGSSSAAGAGGRRRSDAQTQSAESSFSVWQPQRKDHFSSSSATNTAPAEARPTPSSTSFATNTATNAFSAFATNNVPSATPPGGAGDDLFLNSAGQSIAPTLYQEERELCVQSGVDGVVPCSLSSRGAPSPSLLGPSPVPPPAVSPAVVIAQDPFGYDPTYRQFLGQAADGYQYELVRRPSAGALPGLGLGGQLAVPAAAAHVRRASGGALVSSTSRQSPPTLYSTPGGGGAQRSLAANSLRGSFDSCSAAAPPVTPVFIQSSYGQDSQQQVVVYPQPVYAQPLSPRHLRGQQQRQQPAPPQPPPLLSDFGRDRRSPPMRPPATFGEAMPKLIHETSI